MGLGYTSKYLPSPVVGLECFKTQPNCLGLGEQNDKKLVLQQPLIVKILSFQAAIPALNNLEGRY
jgi:hypothetical protein